MRRRQVVLRLGGRSGHATRPLLGYRIYGALVTPDMQRLRLLVAGQSCTRSEASSQAWPLLSRATGRYFSRPVKMPITSTNLPSPYPTRWVASRKATLVRDVQAGLLTLEEACAHYSISTDEFSMWEGRLARHGVRGLRARAFRDLTRADSRRLNRSPESTE